MIPEIYDSFEQWLSNPASENDATEFNPDFVQPKNSDEAFRRYGLPGQTFYNSIKEAQYQPRSKDGEVKLKYNTAFNNIDTDKAWQLWINNGTPIVKEKGFSHLIAKNESTNLNLNPDEMNKVNQVIQSIGASGIQSEGNPLLATLTEFPPQEVDNRTQGEKDLELFENATEMAYETISGAMNILTKDD